MRGNRVGFFKEPWFFVGASFFFVEDYFLIFDVDTCAIYSRHPLIRMTLKKQKLSLAGFARPKNRDFSKSFAIFTF